MIVRLLPLLNHLDHLHVDLLTPAVALRAVTPPATSFGLDFGALSEHFNQLVAHHRWLNFTEDRPHLLYFQAIFQFCHVNLPRDSCRP